jgi:hypothetical protein
LAQVEDGGQANDACSFFHSLDERTAGKAPDGTEIGEPYRRRYDFALKGGGRAA